MYSLIWFLLRTASSEKALSLERVITGFVVNIFNVLWTFIKFPRADHFSSRRRTVHYSEFLLQNLKSVLCSPSNPS